jgi:hypothetical protein
MQSLRKPDSMSELAVRLFSWITGFLGLVFIFLFLENCISVSEFLAMIGIIVSIIPIFLDMSQKRFRNTLFRVFFGGLSEEEVSVLMRIGTGEKTLDEISRKTKLNMTRAHTIVSSLCLRGYLEESVRNGKTYFRLAQLGKTRGIFEDSLKEAPD